MTAWLDELNPAQRTAVTFGDGPLLVVAGAGTGKTKTLACRVAWLIDRGVPADRILLLTFTRRAAGEMLRRAEDLLGPGGTAAVWGGTFHAVANRLLRMYAAAAGLSADFTVMDESDSADLIQLVRTDLGVATGERRFPRKETLRAIYSRMVNAGDKLADVLQRQFPWCADDRADIARIFDGYHARKREQNVLDYDDLLLYWRSLVGSAAGAGVGERFDHVLVDEYQDTNALQSEILRGLRRTRPNVMAVGDDAQAIYSFRAATVRNILDFPAHFPGAQIVTLEENYRSTPAILAASNAVMEQAAERYTKNLWSRRPDGPRPMLAAVRDEGQQCDAVCERVLAHLEEGIPLRRQAVLFRAGHHSGMLEVELARRKIPFVKYGGLRFIEAAHIKDLLAFLRILENPHDELSWFRVLQLFEGVGPKTAQRIIEALGVRRAAPVAPPAGTTPIVRLLDRVPLNAGPAAPALDGLRTALAECRGRRSDGSADRDGDDGGVPLSSQIERIRRFYDPLLRRVYENAPVRLRDLEQLEQIAAGYRSRRSFITDLTLDPPQSTADLAGKPYLEEDYLILSTIHSAKGCEWDVVHVLHAADGMIPSDMALSDEGGEDEERRLLYVAMTRAKNRLYLYFPLRYYHRKNPLGDAHSYAQLSRFITPQVRALLTEQAAFMPAAGEAGDAAGDAQQRLTRLWRDE